MFGPQLSAILALLDEELSYGLASRVLVLLSLDGVPLVDTEKAS